MDILHLFTQQGVHHPVPEIRQGKRIFQLQHVEGRQVSSGRVLRVHHKVDYILHHGRIHLRRVDMIPMEEKKQFEVSKVVRHCLELEVLQFRIEPVVQEVQNGTLVSMGQDLLQTLVVLETDSRGKPGDTQHGRRCHLLLDSVTGGIISRLDPFREGSDKGTGHEASALVLGGFQ